MPTQAGESGMQLRLLGAVPCMQANQLGKSLACQLIHSSWQLPCCSLQRVLLSRLLHALKGLTLTPFPRSTADLGFPYNIVSSLCLFLEKGPDAKIAMLEAHGRASWLAQVFTLGMAGASLVGQVGAVLWCPAIFAFLSGSTASSSSRASEAFESHVQVCSTFRSAGAPWRKYHYYLHHARGISPLPSQVNQI